MADKNIPLLERVHASHKELSAAANNLNHIFDELAKSIDEVDLTLKKLNLGITAWVQVAGRDEGHTSRSLDLGYDRINNKWGIAIRTRSGSYQADQEQSEMWLFNEAPRRLRIEAVEKVPELCDKLMREADAIAARIKGKFMSASISTWQSDGDAHCSTCLEVR